MSIQTDVIEFIQGADGPVSIAEVVEATGAPEGSVKVYLSRGVQRGQLQRPETGLYTATLGPATELATTASVNVEQETLETDADVETLETDDPPAGGSDADEPDAVMVEGVVVLEGQVTGDGRMIETGALRWDDVLPIALIWDRAEGDHTGMTVGSITEMERRENGQVWARGPMSRSEDPETTAAVLRVLELLAEGAVGVSVALDDVSAELRVRMEAVETADAEQTEDEVDEDGRVVVARMQSGDMLEVVTSARPRHVAIVDTAAFSDARIAVAASGSIVRADDDRWAGREHYFDDPQFGEPGQDARIRFDPDLGQWSSPPTVIDDRVFGHIAPSGICLRGRPDRCVTPPDGDLNGFMRHYAPAAGGRRTGVICAGGGHAQTNIGVGEATRFYDNTGRAVADVRVGNDRYGIWFAGMIRPGAKAEDIYALSASDVSGHWEFNQSGRPVLVGLPAVNVGGFPKGWMTHEEVMTGVVASASLGAGCGCDTELDPTEWRAQTTDVLERLESAVAELYAAHLATAFEDVDEEPAEES